MYVLFVSIIVLVEFALCTTTSRLIMSLMNKSKIWLYSDIGTGPGCIENTIFTFNKLLSNQYKVVCVYANDIIDTLPTLSNESLPKLIIFPGGGDLPYQEKLKGIGCSNIRDYVMKGGNYLGICAGGYFGCNEIYFKFGDRLWSSERELSFNNNLKCCGPILAPYDVQSEKGIKIPLIKVTKMENQIFNVYYNGGGHFYFTNKQNGNDSNEWNILATYCINDKDENKNYIMNHLKYECESDVNHNELIAIVHGKFGKGNVILTGCHPEMDPVVLNTNNAELKSIVEILNRKTNNEKRLQLLQIMLSIFDIHAQNISKL